MPRFWTASPLLLAISLTGCASGQATKSVPASQAVAIPVSSVPASGTGEAAPPDGRSVHPADPADREKSRGVMNDLKALHPIVEKWRVDHPGACPSVQQLKDDKEMSSSSVIVDAWGQPYTVMCSEDDSFVRSAGPDRRLGTPDDLVVP